MHGRWVHRLGNAVTYSVPRFVSRSVVARILPYLPQTEVEPEQIDQMQALDPSVPREAGASLVDAMITFSKASDEAYRKFARQFANAYDLMAHDAEVRYATLEEIATKVLGQGPNGKWPETTLWALHRVMEQRTHGFILNKRNERGIRSFEIRPKREGETIELVRDWMRDYQESLIADTTAAATGNPKKSKDRRETNHIAGFIRKARAVVEQSRKRRQATPWGAIGPSSVRVDYNTSINRSTYRSVASDEFRFSAPEILIIRVLEDWTATQTILKHSSLGSLGSMILRATGMYEGYELGLPTGFMFLQELGVVEPWANRLNFQTRLALPGHGLDPETDRLLRESQSAAKKQVSSEPDDAMAGLRKDWGDLEVFCIDSEGAAEIDDGVSLESVGDSLSEFWVHVHTANPSAFISPDDITARYAAHLTETVYFPDVLYPMLSPWLTQKYFSLAPDRPCLTFSAKLTKEGKILDTKITPGTVRNVSHMTPATLYRALSGEDFEAGTSSIPTLTVGGEMPETLRGQRKKNMLQTLSPLQQETLRSLRDLGAAARRRREGQGAVSLTLPRPECLVYLNGSPNDVVYPWRKRPRYIEGDPIISMKPTVFNQTPNPIRYSVEMLVPDLMILAGEVAARWCRDRSVPVIYRGTILNPEIQSPEVFRQEHLDPAVKRHGRAPIHLVSLYLNLIGKSVSSPHPRRHTVLGSEAYTKVTSPLRRYGDLLAHWQIEAALRHEAQTGQSLVASANGSNQFLPFSYSQIESMITRVSERERLISNAKRTSQRHWIMLLLFRAHFFKEARLPETFEMIIYSKGRISIQGYYSGYLTELGVNVEMMENRLTKNHGGVEIGDRWETRIVRIDTYNRNCTMEPVRLIEKAEPVDMGIGGL